MLRTWPAPRRLTGIRVGLLREVAVIAGIIAASLAVAWTDGPPANQVVDPVATRAAFLAAPQMDFSWMAAALHSTFNSIPLPPPPAAKVPSSAPATILIPSLNVHRPIEPVGVDPWGRMYVPRNLWNGGWYQAGPVPGAPGDAVIEGHAGYPKAPLLFANIGKLHRGDRIVIVLADGSRQLFLVSSMAIYGPNASPPGMGQSYGEPRLTLITCTGAFDEHYKTYADRMVVEATYAGLA
jgi:LPXTG-site transpeptidase (sortase) family protein